MKLLIGINDNMCKMFVLLVLLCVDCKMAGCFFLFHRQRANKMQQIQKSSCKTPNVRTVLFDSRSLYKSCWNAEEMAMLLSRAIMQSILPRRMPRNMPLMFEYFKECLDTVKQEVRNKKIRIWMATVMIDVLGGYLQAYGLPIMKRIYYEGNLEYEVISKFDRLEDNFKTILGTDGGGWTKPMHVTTRSHRFTNVTALKTVATANEDACKRLITYTLPITGQGGVTSKWLMIPMPRLDDANQPHAIAVPLKNSGLYSIQCKCNHDTLITYYLTSLQCLSATSSNNTNDMINYFELNFYKWIKKYVLPRLNDENWYAGFYGIFRILTTIKMKGLPLNSVPKLNILKCSESKSATSSETWGENRTAKPAANNNNNHDSLLISKESKKDTVNLTSIVDRINNDPGNYLKFCCECGGEKSTESPDCCDGDSRSKNVAFSVSSNFSLVHSLLYLCLAALSSLAMFLLIWKFYYKHQQSNKEMNDEYIPLIQLTEKSYLTKKRKKAHINEKISTTTISGTTLSGCTVSSIESKDYTLLTTTSYETLKRTCPVPPKRKKHKSNKQCRCTRCR